jgi:NAD(P)-dependent dehydrogenase (short-subunit alcohol dehydrogenase family)
MGVLDGRVAIVTGGGRGIGAEIARAFARDGAAVVVNDLGAAPDGSGDDKMPVHDVVAEITAAGGAAVADDGDVSDVRTGQRLVDTAVEKFGKLDVLVNVAGILRDRMIFNLSEEDWDAVIRVHLKGHYSTVRPASAYFREQRNPNGHYRIINFSSASGLYGAPGQPNYAAAKMGVIGLTYSLAQGLARYGVTANAIAPGAATRLTATVPGDKVPELEFSADELAPENITPIVTYLASTRSSWLTGRTLAAAGYEVELISNPEAIRQISTTGKWEFETLAGLMERKIRPVANGLPRNPFVLGSS